MQEKPLEIGDAQPSDDTLQMSPELAALQAHDAGFSLKSGSAEAPARPATPPPASGSSQDQGRHRGRIGQFRIIREIGRGGMGEVYEAVDDVLGRHVALKVLPMAGLLDDQQVRRFRNEAAAAAQLEHPNIVPVYSVGQDRGLHYYAMQLIEGRNVAQVIGGIRDRLSTDQGRRQSATPLAAGTTLEHAPTPKPTVIASDSQKSAGLDAPLSADDFVAAASDRKSPVVSHRLFKKIAMIGRDAAMAIGYAHEQGVVHRDIKPSNLLLDGKGKIWITDFGLAQIQNVPGETRTGDVVGTLRYMSPEQATGRKFLIDHRTDVYSLGVTLYELFSLRQAFNGKGAKELLRQLSFEEPPSLRQVNPRIPQELELIVGKAIAKNPQERYTSAYELAADLERYCRDQPISARKPTLRQNIRRWINKHETLTAVIGVMIVMSLLFAVAGAGVVYQAYLKENVQRKRTQELLDQSEGLRLIASSSLILPDNPGLALALAAEGAKSVTGLEANQAVAAAFDLCHELRTFFPQNVVLPSVVVGNRSDRAVVMPAATNSPRTESKTVVIDLKTGGTISTLDLESPVRSSAFAPDDSLLLSSLANAGTTEHGGKNLSANEGGTAVLWDASSGDVTASFPQCRLREATRENFSPDGLHLVIPGPDNVATVFDGRSGAERFRLVGHGQTVHHAVFSPTGNRLATADASGEIRIWKDDGTQTGLIAAHDATPISQLQFTSDGQSLVYANGSIVRLESLDGAERQHEGSPLVWRGEQFVLSPSSRLIAIYSSHSNLARVRETSSGVLVAEFEFDSPAVAVSFSDDNRTLAVANGSVVTLCNVTDGTTRIVLRGHDGPVRSLQRSAQDGLWVTAAADHSIRVWSEQSGHQRSTFAAATDGRSATQPEFSRDGRKLIVPSVADSESLVFSSAGQRQSALTHARICSDTMRIGQLLTADGAVLKLTDSGTGRYLASVRIDKGQIHDVTPFAGHEQFLIESSDDDFYFWRLRDGDVLSRVGEAGERSLCGCVSRDGSRFGVGLQNGRCCVYEGGSGRLLATLPHVGAVVAVAITDGGSHVVTVDEFSAIRTWTLADEPVVATMKKSDEPIDSVAVSADGAMLVTWHQLLPSPVVCRKLESLESVAQCPGGRQTCVALEPDAPRVAVGSLSSGLAVLDYSTGDIAELNALPTAGLNVLDHAVIAVQFASDFDFSASAHLKLPRSGQSAVRMFQLDSKQLVAEIQEQWGQFSRRVAVDAEAAAFAVSCKQYSSVLCDMERTQEPKPIGSFQAPVSHSSFIGERDDVLTTSWDGTAAIWDHLANRRTVLSSGGAPISAAAVTTDGRIVALGRSDGLISIVQSDDGTQLKELNGTASPISRLQFDESGRTLLSVHLDGHLHVWSLISGMSRDMQLSGSLPRAGISRSASFVLALSKPDSASAEETSPDRVTVWNQMTGEQQAVAGTQDCVAVSLANTEDRFLTGSNTGVLVEHEIQASGELMSSAIAYATANQVINVAWSADDRFVSVLDDRGISVLDRLADYKLVRRVDGVSGLASAMSGWQFAQQWQPLSPDGEWLAMTGLETRAYMTLPDPQRLQGLVRPLTDVELSRFGIHRTEQ